MREDKCFVDTNILVYAYDRSSGNKHTIAKQLLLEFWQTRCSVISTQVLQEFFVNVTRKIPRPLDIPTARSIVSDLLNWPLIVNDGHDTLAAIDLQQSCQLSFWDALIINAAIRSGATKLLSEDLNHGQQFDKVLVTNPFLNPGP